MIQVLRTTSENQDFISLIRMLDADLAARDGADHSFYSQFNTITTIRHAVVAYLETQPVGCGAIKPFDPHTMEVKRMFVKSEFRHQRIAQLILLQLEAWAQELNCVRCVLETGKRQPEAIQLYTKAGYKPIPNYGQYVGIDNSVCFEKMLSV